MELNKLKMEIHNLFQGSPEWNAYRETKRNASDAPAMRNVSKYKSRTELLDEVKTGVMPEFDAFTQKLFSEGHIYEALARPLAEEIIGEELYPITASKGIYSASFDGLTINEDIAFEHKKLNDSIRACNSIAELDEMYLVQMEQQLMISNAKHCFFLATSWQKTDEVTDHAYINENEITYYKLVEKKEFIYLPNAKRRQQIIDGWAQFDKDLETHVPTVKTEKPVAEVAESFPVVSIQVRGEVVLCNLPEITPRFDKFLAETNTKLTTDQEFADGEYNAKLSRETAKTLKLTAKAVVDQILPVSDAVRTLEAYAEKFDKLGLALEKAVKEQKEMIKSTAIGKINAEYLAHVASIEEDIKPIRLVTDKPDFTGAIKGLKNIDSLNNNLKDCLTNKKIELDGLAREIRAKHSWFKSLDNTYSLFYDIQQLIYKPIDDFKLQVNSRIASHEEMLKERDESIEKMKQAMIQPNQAMPEVMAQTIQPMKLSGEVVEISTVKKSNIINPRPDASEVIACVASYFNVDSETALEWIVAIDAETLTYKVA